MTRYKENFKQMIVELNQTGRSVRGLAKEYGLSEATIYKWKNLYLPNPSTGLTGKEVAELRKENARLKEKLEILKKAAAIFSRKT
ncbi:transposase [Enterococcus faecalis]|uniref:transposase n=1 Tax=Enterococcus faecalis TaxID=1351 RepID=UPI00244D8E1D|nr:transposase [Enterococcus faecalis]GMC15907.1 transposase [Enterococcus faecalis]